MTDLRLALMAGIDIAVPECPVVIHQPRIKEIAYLGEKEFLTAVQTLCLQKNMFQMDESVSSAVNNFQIFMTIMNNEETKDKKQMVTNLLNMICPNYKIGFTPRTIFFNKEDSNIILDEGNFDSFQEILRQVFCVNSGAMGDNNAAFNPADDQARKIAEKLMRGRQRVAAQKGEGAGSIFAQYTSILTVGLSSMSLHDILNLTMFQMYDLVERYSLYINWDLDIKTRLAGGKPDQSPDNWMKNIH